MKREKGGERGGGEKLKISRMRLSDERGERQKVIKSNIFILKINTI